MSPKITMGLRVLLGVFILFFGINKFAGMMEFPPMEGDAADLMRIYATSGFLKLIGVFEILCGLALISGKYVPLALTFMVAIMFNATLFHALHNMENIPGALFGLVLSLVMVYAYREKFSDLLSA